MTAAGVAVMTLATLGLLTASQAAKASGVDACLAQPLAVNESPGGQSDDQGSAASPASLASQPTSTKSGNIPKSTEPDPRTEPAREASALDEWLKLEKQLDEASRWYWNKQLDDAP